jgi:hypothetical protein
LFDEFKRLLNLFIKVLFQMDKEKVLKKLAKAAIDIAKEKKSE